MKGRKVLVIGGPMDGQTRRVRRTGSTWCISILRPGPLPAVRSRVPVVRRGRRWVALWDQGEHVEVPDDESLPTVW